jgi:DNA-binding GntR family transcriptional regulator
MKTQPIKANKQKQAYEFLRGKILSGEYGPGYRLVIDQVSKELGISKIPVREAIRQLEADGFIHYKPYSGAVVSAINEREYMEVISVLAVLEGYATAISSREITDETLDKLRELNRQMEESVREFEFEKFGALNREFHKLIYDNCSNRYLAETTIQMWEQMDRIRRSVFIFVPKRALESIKEHEHIIRLMKEKAPFQEIEQFVRAHKLNTATAFEQFKKKEGTQTTFHD